MQARVVGDAVTAARGDHGLLLIDGAVDTRTAGPGKSWARQLGLRLQPLATPLPTWTHAALDTARVVHATAQREAEPARTARRELLDASALKARRLELGLSERELAADAGTSQVVLRSMEAGINHAELTLATLTGVAGTLGMPIVINPTAPAAAGRRPSDQVGAAASAESGASEDARALGAALHEVRVMTSKTLLARGLGWDLARLAAAADVLSEQLGGTGLMLQRPANGQLGVLRDRTAIAADALRRVLEAQAAEPGGLRLNQAELLCEIAAGTFTERDSNAQRATLAWALNRQLIDKQSVEPLWRLTDRSRASLLT